MKNIIKSLAMAVAALAFASCQKAEIETSQPAPQSEGLTVDISICELDDAVDDNGDDTRAAKKGWANGDVIDIWYGDNLTIKPDLVIVYRNGKWEIDPYAQTSGKNPAASGLLHMMYIQGGKLDEYMELGTQSVSGAQKPALKFKKSTTTVNSKNKPATIPMIAHASKVSYTVTNNKLTATVNTFAFLNNTHIVIDGLPEGKWALAGDVFRPREAIYVNEGGFGVTSASTANGNYVFGIKESDGTAFCVNATTTDGPFKFTLVNTDTGRVLYYNASGKTISTSSTVRNYARIKYYKFHSTKVAVDLGLSVNWGEVNVGAEDIIESGLYYQWGDRQGYAASETKLFYWTDNSTGTITYKWYGGMNGAYRGMTKYVPSDRKEYGYNNFTDGKYVLEADDDAAASVLGYKWRMPTASEWKELLSPANTTMTWTYIGNTPGYKIQSKKAGYTDNWIFLPAAGERTLNFLTFERSACYYWSSSISPTTPDNAYNVYMTESDISDARFAWRCYGYPIRPVLPK